MTLKFALNFKIDHWHTGKDLPGGATSPDPRQPILATFGQFCFDSVKMFLGKWRQDFNFIYLFIFFILK